MIKAIVTDVDGVLTDGDVYITSNGEEQKNISFKDLDAVSMIIKENIIFGVITGEDNFFTKYIKEKFNPKYMYTGCKSKLEALSEIAEKEAILLDEIAYIGDGKYDIECIKQVGLGVCPADAIAEVKKEANVILKSDAGKGCLSEVYTYIKQMKESEKNFEENETEKNINIEKRVASVFKEHSDLVKKVIEDSEIQQEIEKSIQEMVRCFKNCGQVLFCGNGGSAADAQHLATEFVSRFYLERKSLNAEALNVNTSSITAIANDYDYNRIFARQAEAKGKMGDILVGISTSGASQNVIEAFKCAKRIGMKTIALCGENKNKMQGIVDIIISVPSSITPRIQEMHITIGHIICECVEKELFS